jgi:hypothetical protein
MSLRSGTILRISGKQSGSRTAHGTRISLPVMDFVQCRERSAMSMSLTAPRAAPIFKPRARLTCLREPSLRACRGRRESNTEGNSTLNRVSEDAVIYFTGRKSPIRLQFTSVDLCLSNVNREDGAGSQPNDPVGRRTKHRAIERTTATDCHNQQTSCREQFKRMTQS